MTALQIIDRIAFCIGYAAIGGAVTPMSGRSSRRGDTEASRMIRCLPSISSALHQSTSPPH